MLVRCVQPKVIVSCNCGIEPTRVVEYKPIVDKAIRLSSHKPQFLITHSRPPVCTCTRTRLHLVLVLVLVCMYC